MGRAHDAQTLALASDVPGDGPSLVARLERDQTVDACVTGAGMAGLVIALELAERGRSVVVLEREGHCRGSRFDCYGKVLAGPAMTDLEALPRAQRKPAKAG